VLVIGRSEFPLRRVSHRDGGLIGAGFDTKKTVATGPCLKTFAAGSSLAAARQDACAARRVQLTISIFSFLEFRRMRWVDAARPIPGHRRPQSFLRQREIGPGKVAQFARRFSSRLKAGALPDRDVADLLEKGCDSWVAAMLAAVPSRSEAIQARVSH